MEKIKIYLIILNNHFHDMEEYFSYNGKLYSNLWDLSFEIFGYNDVDAFDNRKDIDWYAPNGNKIDFSEVIE